MAAGGSLGSWEARSILVSTFPLLVGLSVVVLYAGFVLEDAGDLLAEFGSLAVMVPVMIATGGNLGAILSSRLSTRLHLGTTAFDPRDRTLWANVAAILALAATLFTALAVGAWLVERLVGSGAGPTLPELLTIALASGMSVAVVAVAFGLAATYGSYRLGIDPDDTTIPIVTNLVDVFGMVIFVAVSRAVLL
jgi:mgtE-like transporter